MNCMQARSNESQGARPETGSLGALMAAQLQELALRYQQARDGLSSSASSAGAEAAGSTVLHHAAEAVGQAFSTAVHAACRVMGSSAADNASEVLNPITRRTSLAKLIVAYLQWIPCEEVTPRMVLQPTGTPLAAVHNCTRTLVCLLNAALAQQDMSGESRVALLFLWQVNTATLFLQ